MIGDAAFTTSAGELVWVVSSFEAVDPDEGPS